MIMSHLLLTVFPKFPWWLESPRHLGGGIKQSTSEGLPLKEFVSVGQVNLGYKMVCKVLPMDAAALPESLLKMQILGPHARPTEPEGLWV